MSNNMGNNLLRAVLCRLILISAVLPVIYYGFDYVEPVLLKTNKGKFTPKRKNRTFEQKTSGEGYIIDHTSHELGSTRIIGKGKKIVLMWNFLSNYRISRNAHSYCAYSNCYFTFDRDYFNDSDVVMFNLFTLKVGNLPRYRPAEQAWIAYESEPPKPTMKYAEFNDVMNGTMTYRDDSDVPLPYGFYRRHDKNDTIKYDARVNYAANRTKLVAWLVSHCSAKSLRDDYARELGKHVQLDKYGSCGFLTCGTTDECMSLIGQYKFYLAFENMLCDQYVTEKVWRTLQYTERFIVPVVLGGSNYTSLLPPHSFIDIRDFSSPQKLAHYLKYLHRNDTAYNEYFKWRQEYTVVIPGKDCVMCAYANNKSKIVLKSRDLHKWWTEDRCVSPHMYYRGVADKLTETFPVLGPNIAKGKAMPPHSYLTNTTANAE